VQAGLFDSILQSRREDKRRRFLAKLAGGYDGPVILAEGDSWFEYPISEDLLVPLGEKYAIFSLAKAGDSFTEIEDQDELFPTLDNPPPGREFHIVMLSLGGNEVMGHIEDFVHQNDPARPDEDYILPNFAPMLEGVRDKFDAIARRILGSGPQHVILHGYDYPDPRFPPEPTESPNGSQWIGPPLMHQRRIGQITTYREIANRMADQFNAMLATIAARPQYQGRVHAVRLLGTIGKRNKTQAADPTLWVDEIHGTDKGFRTLARKFETVIDAVWEGMHLA
jgi:hypothetical protein